MRKFIPKTPIGKVLAGVVILYVTIQVIALTPSAAITTSCRNSTCSSSWHPVGYIVPVLLAALAVCAFVAAGRQRFARRTR